jgi:hypothetical protein
MGNHHVRTMLCQGGLRCLTARPDPQLTAPELKPARSSSRAADGAVAVAAAATPLAAGLRALLERFAAQPMPTGSGGAAAAAAEREVAARMLQAVSVACGAVAASGLLGVLGEGPPHLRQTVVHRFLIFWLYEL